MHCKPKLHRGNLVFIAGIPCNENRFSLNVWENCTGKTLFSPCNDPVRDCSSDAFSQHAKNYMQPAQIKLHPDENFLHHAKIQPPCFAGQIKRAQSRQTYITCVQRSVPGIQKTFSHSICTHYFRFKNKGWFVTLKKDETPLFNVSYTYLL